MFGDLYEKVVVDTFLDEYVETHLEHDSDVKMLYKNIFESLCEGDKVLEIGSAPFVMTKRLIDKGFDTTGVDKSYENKHINVVKCDIEKEELPFKDNTFDVVLFIDVFEHLSIDPFFAIKNIQRVLKKD